MSSDSPRVPDVENDVGDTYVSIGEYLAVTLVNFCGQSG